MGNNVLTKERIYKFDNIKLFAMILVVLGHLIDAFTGKSMIYKGLFLFIYTFHMPLFMFISGLFQKRYTDKSELKVNKVAFYVSLGVLLKIINASSKVPKGVAFNINWIGGGEVDWFMFVLSAYIILTYLFRKVHPAIMLTVTAVLGSCCGYFDVIHDTLWLSRFFVFFPIYLLGYYMTPEQLLKISKNLAVKIISGISMLVYFVMCFRALPLVYQLRRLFTGRNPFSTLPFENCGFQHRLLCYGIALMLCLAVICFMPNIKIPVITNMGKNTLAVYFWHRPILHLLSATALFPTLVNSGSPLNKLILLIFGVALTLLLSFNIFSAPLRWLQKLIDKLQPFWHYAILYSPFVICAIASYF